MVLQLKKRLGIQPQSDDDQGFSPSPVALKLATKNTTDYDQTAYANAYTGDEHRILMVCTQERYMTMQNGKKFLTGNHPVETLVPLLHFERAGFDVDVCTPTGEPVQLEQWAMPKDDDAVMHIYAEYEQRFAQPKALNQIVEQALGDDSPYVAVFIPGGHGAMLGLPQNEDLGQLINWVVEQDKHMFSICHGPAALLAANINKAGGNFAYQGYKMAVFPDSVDKMTPLFGYMPGKMPWYFGDKLKALGVDIVNKKPAGVCHQDRKLITGDSPDAANEFGKLAAKALLDEYA